MNHSRGDLPWAPFHVMLGTAVCHSATHHKPWELRLELDGGLECKKSRHSPKYNRICTLKLYRSRANGRLWRRIVGSWSHGARTLRIYWSKGREKRSLGCIQCAAAHRDGDAPIKMLSELHDTLGVRGAATRPPRASPTLAEEAPAVR